MMISLRLPKLFRLPKVIDLFTPLLFLYFVTLHADRLSFQVGGTVRFNNLLALALIVILTLRLRKEFFRIERWLFWSFALIIFSILLSLVCSPHWKNCVLYLFWFGFVFLCYFWMPYQLFAKLDRQKVLKLYFASFFVVGFYAFCQLFTAPLGDPFVGQWIIPACMGRPNAFSYEPSYYVLYMTPFVFHQTLLYIARDKSVSGRRLLFINFFYLVSTSTSAICSYLIFIFLTLFYRQYHKKLWSLVVKLAIGMLPIFMIGGAIAISLFLKNLDLKKHHSISERWEGIWDCYTLFKQRPIIGYGLGGVAHERVAQGLYLEKYNSPTGEVFWKAAEPTNLGTEILASLGLIGTAAFAILIFLFTRCYFKRRSSCWDDAFFISVLVMLVTWQFNQSLMRPYTWTYFAFACAFLRTNLQSQQVPLVTESAQIQDKAL